MCKDKSKDKKTHWVIWIDNDKPKYKEYDPVIYYDRDRNEVVDQIKSVKIDERSEKDKQAQVKRIESGRFGCSSCRGDKKVGVHVDMNLISYTLMNGQIVMEYEIIGSIDKINNKLQDLNETITSWEDRLEKVKETLGIHDY
jgi:hypothetical protein